MIDIPDSLLPHDSGGNILCPKCKALVKDCTCPVPEKPPEKKLKLNPKIFFEKSGRKGKAVTLVKNLPRDERLLKDLSRKLKNTAGCGGTFYFSEGEGVIEIQGDHREKMSDYFKRVCSLE